MKNFVLWMVAIFVVLSLWGEDEPSSDVQNRVRYVEPTIPTSQPNQTTNSQTRPTVSPDVSTYLFVTGNRVNQRQGPSTEFAPMGQLSKGARVRLVRSSDGWTEVVSSLGAGWMSSRYLSRSAPEVAPARQQPTRRQVAAPTSREIQVAREAIIRQSIASYPGSCPCPYNVDRGGRRCGGRSAWSRPGGYSPICYDSDVSQSRLDSYFARLR